jgi:hypothetical protein
MAFGRADDVTAEAEMAAIAQIGCDDAPTADPLAVRWRTHVGTTMSLGSRTRL